MNIRISSLDVELTRRCNLCCPYCYTKQGPCGAGASDMAPETIGECLDLLARFGDSSKGKPPKVNFYGGEPMLAFDGIVRLVEEAAARGLKLSYGIVTNGTVGTPEQAQWLREHNVSLQRSIDGGPEALAISRPGILDRYRANMEIFDDRRGTRRGTVAPAAAKHLLRSIRFIHEELGCAKGGAFIPDIYSTWSPIEQTEFRDSLWQVGEELAADWAAGKRWRFHHFDKPIAALRGGQGSATHCGAGRSLHAVSWDGYLFPCHRFCSEPRDGEICAGSLTEVLAGTARGYGEPVQRRLRHARDRVRPAMCNGCIASNACPGGCAHENWKAGRSIDEPPELQCMIRRECVRVIAWVDAQLSPILPHWPAEYAALSKGVKPQPGARPPLTPVLT